MKVINERLWDIEECLQKEERFKRRLDDVMQELDDIRQKKEHLLERLQKEEEDVEQLTGFHPYNVFYRLMGTKEERLLKERQEAAQAKLSYDEIIQAENDLQQEAAAYREEIAKLGTLHQEYEELLKEKEDFLKNQDSFTRKALEELIQKEQETHALGKELDEAVNAGKAVQRALNEAIASFEKASSWGTFDMFGGGLISTAIKQSHMGDGREIVHRAQQALRRFKRELKDVQHSLDLHLEADGFSQFADFFFDGLITDWVVQGEIELSLEHLKKQNQEVRRVLRIIEQHSLEVKKEEDQYSDARKRLVMNS
ncbi:hypothetical protein G4V62_05785 [Bacillaceae bacterium SIJ1]|uniref:hypothetical protein n=1 Tax=Litoribacterium kuwaitense TaxID=1398745 RepID=UPI0013EBD74C|nr:hypothetical protein [Litoribacterium kuwaitense]NGP44492.1 hypothetical protein [Litoribacterium kuwaitense]